MFPHGSNWSRKGSNAVAERDLTDAPYSIVCRLHDRKEETLLNRKIGFFFLRVWPVFLRLSPVWCIWFPIPVSESCFFSPHRQLIPQYFFYSPSRLQWLPTLEQPKAFTISILFYMISTSRRENEKPRFHFLRSIRCSHPSPDRRRLT